MAPPRPAHTQQDEQVVTSIRAEAKRAVTALETLGYPDTPWRELPEEREQRPGGRRNALSVLRHLTA